MGGLLGVAVGCSVAVGGQGVAAAVVVAETTARLVGWGEISTGPAVLVGQRVPSTSRTEAMAAATRPPVISSEDDASMRRVLLDRSLSLDHMWVSRDFQWNIVTLRVTPSLVIDQWSVP